MSRFASLSAAVAVALTLLACDGSESDPATGGVADADAVEETTTADSSVTPDTGDVAASPETAGDDVAEELPPLSGPSQMCLETSCELQACLDVTECAWVADCLGNCDTISCGEQCLIASPPPFKGVIGEALHCGVAASCFTGGSGLETCGNETCDEGETKLSCPGDCSPIGKPDEMYACLLEMCDVGYCLTSTSCIQRLECITMCEDSTCINTCFVGAGGFQTYILVSAISCGVSSGCLPESVALVCGNETCDPGEGSLNCPEDCGEPDPAYLCMVESCDVGNCPNFGGCNNGLLCMAGCETSECTDACIEAGPGQAAGFLRSIGACAAQEGCIPAEAAPSEQ